MDTDKISLEIKEILNEAQHSSSNHQRSLYEMKKMYAKCNHEEFLDVFTLYLSTVLQQDYRVVNPFVEKMLNFLAHFCASFASSEDDTLEENSLVYEIIYFLLETQCNENNIVRFRSCQLLNQILDKLIGVDMDVFLYNYIQECMLGRINDTNITVRLQAVLALYRLQDPTDPKDPVINEFVKHMDLDPSYKVRKSCLEYVAVCRNVVPHIILKMRDVNVSVRLAAFKRVAELPNHFTIEEKQRIIKIGFMDTDTTIKKFVSEHLVLSWLKHYNYDYLKLLNKLKLDSDANDFKESINVMNYVLKSLLSTRPHMELLGVLKHNDDHVLPLENLTLESMIYWYNLIGLMKTNSENEEILAEILPELVNFCKYVESYYDVKVLETLNEEEYLEFQFILKHMIMVMQGYDFGDVATREGLKDFIIRILKTVELENELVKVIVESLKFCTPDLEVQKEIICTLISDILDTKSDKIYKQRAEIEEKLNEAKSKFKKLKAELNYLVQSGKFEEATEVNNKIGDCTTSIEMFESTISSLPHEDEHRNWNNISNENILKCLDIAEAILSTENVTKLCPNLISLKVNLIEEMLSHEEETIRLRSLKCYALCCLLDRTTANTGIHLLSAPILTYIENMPCDIDTLLIAISAVSDLLHMFGSSLITSPDDNGESDSVVEEHICIFKGGTSLTALIRGLVDLINDETSEIQECATKGLCSLVICNIVSSSAVISRLFLKWSHPIADDDEAGQKIIQIIGNLFAKFPSLPDAGKQLEDALLPTLRAFIRAPQHTPLSTVNIEKVIKFILHLCLACTEGEQIHLNIATNIANEIKSKPSSKNNRIFTKVLCNLTLPNDINAIKLLTDLYTDVREEICCRETQKNIATFMAILKIFQEKVTQTETIEE